MASEQIIRGMFPGEDKILVFDVEDDASEWDAEFVLSLAGETLLTKTIASGISVTDATSGDDHGLAVQLDSADTEDWAAVSYAFVLRRTDVANRTVQAYGQFILGAERGNYSSSAAVVGRTGVKFDDLGLADEDALDAFLTDLLAEVSDLMNQSMRRDYIDEGAIPAGLNGIAADMATDAVTQMLVTRQSRVVRIDDFAIRTVTSRVLTPDIEKRLRRYAVGMSTVTIGGGDLAGGALDPEIVDILGA